MNSNDINSLPPEIVLEQYTNEVKGIISRFESNIYLLEKQGTFNEAGKVQKDNIDSLLIALKRVTELAEDYLNSR